ncbi:MAG TPA: HAMP domain-containing sensor histidine kinase, partial [Chitinophagales bacterium]|nr:HAMP domain-containing sensor histidine kinase [Chitinophagales bacterium]
LVAYLLFSTARRAEQNKVWLGMAKETAHQLGTPLSSLMGWVEMLKTVQDPDGINDMIAQEVGKDVERLQLIADRFSKIGSIPKLQNSDVVDEVRQTLYYVKRRASSRVSFHFDETTPPIIIALSPVLFDWVIENLLKNALDAMDGKGEIRVAIAEDANDVVIDVTDTGKGIPKSRFITVFEPGYSTKKRGWGLGLSLSKRIIETYHKGKIFVAHSSPNEGATFRVILPNKKVAETT